MNAWQVILSVVWLIVASNSPAAADPISFKTGKALATAMSARVSWSSVGVPIGDQLRDLQQQSEVAILRDRRVDPRQLISVETEFVPRIQVLKQISGNIPEGAFCLTEQLACVGPAVAVSRLPILLEHNNNQLNALRRKLDASAFRRLTADAEVSWPQLAEPRQILLDQAKAAGTTIKNPDAIPHDVWAAGQLPRMTFVELATVILNQFDLTLKLVGDSAELSIVPIDAGATLEHRYAVGSKLRSGVISAWQDRVPDVVIKWTGSTAVVTTTLDEHALMNSILLDLEHPDAPIKAAGSIRTTNYQLKAERATIGQLIDYFRSQKVKIEMIDADSAETRALLTELVQLDTITEKQPGTKFFPLVFGKHFSKVEVLDDRVILSRE